MNRASPVILASTSPYRRDLLARLGIPFTVAASAVEETPLPDETPAQLVQRLAQAKAGAVFAQQPQAIVIGADQMAVCEGAVLGKPGNAEGAARQLRRISGKRVDFMNGLAIMAPSLPVARVELIIYTVHMRALSDQEIADYIRRDRPFDCAGSFRSEGLGIALASRLEGEDPTALIGLPLIRLCALLAAAGRPVLG
ncbi:MAG: Maf family protein [Acidithiobacillus sp.]